MFKVSDGKVAAFRDRLLAWYPRGRRRFSWRERQRNAYQTLVAEMMLRKTDAAKVERVYGAFLERYPTPRELAEADEAELRVAIQPLGIADRARLLRLTAQTLLREHKGKVPASAEALRRLPGVGRYTSNAVLCFAYRGDVPLLDTNVIRVIERVFGVRSSKPRAREDPELWEFAARLVPPGKAVTYNRAVLDFAAAVCTASAPKCSTCPLLPTCDYGQTLLGGTARTV